MDPNSTKTENVKLLVVNCHELTPALLRFVILLENGMADTFIVAMPGHRMTPTFSFGSPTATRKCKLASFL